MTTPAPFELMPPQTFTVTMADGTPAAPGMLPPTPALTHKNLSEDEFKKRLAERDGSGGCSLPNPLFPASMGTPLEVPEAAESSMADFMKALNAARASGFQQDGPSGPFAPPPGFFPSKLTADPQNVFVRAETVPCGRSLDGCGETCRPTPACCGPKRPADDGFQSMMGAMGAMGAGDQKTKAFFVFIQEAYAIWKKYDARIKEPSLETTKNLGQVMALAFLQARVMCGFDNDMNPELVSACVRFLEVSNPGKGKALADGWNSVVGEMRAVIRV
jgi:hypothetical protein